MESEAASYGGGKPPISPPFNAAPSKVLASASRAPSPGPMISRRLKRNSPRTDRMSPTSEEEEEERECKVTDDDPPSQRAPSPGPMISRRLKRNSPRTDRMSPTSEEEEERECKATDDNREAEKKGGGTKENKRKEKEHHTKKAQAQARRAAPSQEAKFTSKIKEKTNISIPLSTQTIKSNDSNLVVKEHINETPQRRSDDSQFQKYVDRNRTYAEERNLRQQQQQQQDQSSAVVEEEKLMQPSDASQFDQYVQRNKNYLEQRDSIRRPLSQSETIENATKVSKVQEMKASTGSAASVLTPTRSEELFDKYVDRNNEYYHFDNNNHENNNHFDKYSDQSKKQPGPKIGAASITKGQNIEQSVLPLHRLDNKVDNKVIKQGASQSSDAKRLEKQIVLKHQYVNRDREYLERQQRNIGAPLSSGAEAEAGARAETEAREKIETGAGVVASKLNGIDDYIQKGKNYVKRRDRMRNSLLMETTTANPNVPLLPAYRRMTSETASTGHTTTHVVANTTCNKSTASGEENRELLNSVNNRVSNRVSNDMLRAHLTESFANLSVAERHMQQVYTNVVMSDTSNKLMNAELALENAAMVVAGGDQREVQALHTIAASIVDMCKNEEMELEEFTREIEMFKLQNLNYPSEVDTVLRILSPKHTQKI